MKSAMTPFHEKLYLGATHLAGYGLCSLGAILSTGDSRWFLVTTAFSTLTSGFLTMIFKRPEETINIVAGRSGIAILGGIFLSKYLTWQFNITVVHTDTVALGGLASFSSAAMFIMGYKVLRYIEKRSDYFAKKFVDGKASVILGPNEPTSLDPK